MIKNENNKESYYKRVKERRFWGQFGVILLAFGFSIVAGSTVSSFFLHIPFTLQNILTGLSYLMIILGGVFGIFIARLGWSESRLLDLFFNRLGIILIIFSQVLSTAHTIFGYILESITNYTNIMFLIGFILILLGMRFQSYVEDSKLQL